jgi:capsular polysaccharide biosynthesis protein
MSGQYNSLCQFFLFSPLYRNQIDMKKNNNKKTKNVFYQDGQTDTRSTHRYSSEPHKKNILMNE